MMSVHVCRTRERLTEPVSRSYSGAAPSSCVGCVDVVLRRIQIMTDRDYKLTWIVVSLLAATWAALAYVAWSMGIFFG